MQISCLEDLWILAGHTRQNYPFILVGHASTEKAYRKMLSLGLEMSSIMMIDSCHPIKLDILLATKLQVLAGFFSIAGCTIHVPNVPGSSGGVLGDPTSRPSSAAGLVENLKNSWSLVTFPAGPGMAQNVRLSRLPPSIKALCTENTPDHYMLQQLSTYTNSIGADKFIAVTDGSGPGACGVALIRNQSKTMLWCLDEMVDQ
jgi:hypothetical protein